MFAVKVDVSDALKGLRQMRKVARKMTADLIFKAAGIVEEEAKRKVPVDTGNLARSIETVSRADFVALVGSDLPYARTCEFGWSSQAPNGYLFISLEETRKEVLAYMVKGWARIIDEVAK